MKKNNPDIFKNFSTITNSEEETINLARIVSKEISPPLVIILIGTLGSGKTLFVKGIAKSLGINVEVVSPTFTILNQYFTNDIILNHFDLYRINNFEELYYIGIEDLLNNEKAINIFEWGEQFIDYFKEFGIKMVKIEIEILPNYSRKFNIELI